MKVSDLIKELQQLPQDANVYCVWDGEPRSSIDLVWEDDAGDIMLMDESGYVYSARPKGFTTQQSVGEGKEIKKYLETKPKDCPICWGGGVLFYPYTEETKPCYFCEGKGKIPKDDNRNPYTNNMKTIVNIGTSRGNIRGVEFDKPFEEITGRDVLIAAMKKFPKALRISIIGWVNMTPKTK